MVAASVAIESGNISSKWREHLECDGYIQVVQLFKETTGIEFTVVFCPQVLDCLVDCLLVSSANYVSSPAQSMVFILISTVLDS